MQKLKKITISTGMYWIEVQEAGIYVLCGCPAESVKHLMKRGLIISSERSGISFETGPNAILLSDVMLQNGSFSNMAEFPVLQMLYRQGMMLPNHPNNTGVKPLLIGSEEQVNTQMQYIYRGNYGLISKQELMDAGSTPEEADEMMRMKLKFAFGQIRDTREFIDSLIVEKSRVEIRNGIGIRRLGFNEFEFDYKGETATVNLNISPLESYLAPFPRGFHNIEREYFAVIHSGEGDGWDVNRSSMASIIMFHGKIYLIDAGPNIIKNLIALGIGVNEIEGIFHTHSHDDHFAGLPTLIQTDCRIKYYATSLVRASVTKKLCALLSMEEERFADYFEIHDLVADEWNNVEGMGVKPVFSPHPVETNIFMFRALWEDGYRTYAHLADIASFDVLRGMVCKNEAEIGISETFYNKAKQAYMVPADLKKIDIGGGLIHGRAEDFHNDKSKKIVLAHTALEFTDEQKEIGSGAPFGTIDKLIPTYQDYGLRGAFGYLKGDFKTAPMDQLRILLNNKTVSFNPETIILKEGVINDQIYLILTGCVEMIQSSRGIRNWLNAGSLVGEISGLRQSPSPHTYRAASFVQTLRISSSLYTDFVKLNNLYGEIERLEEGWNFLQETHLFGEAISFATHNNVAEKLKLQDCPADYTFNMEGNTNLFIVKEGSLERSINNRVFETIKPGDYFGEETALLKKPDPFVIKTTEPSTVYKIPNTSVQDIPIVNWKLFECYEKRRRLV